MKFESSFKVDIGLLSTKFKDLAESYTNGNGGLNGQLVPQIDLFLLNG